MISIGELAFGHFNEMKVIELPSTLETLKWGAFMNNRFNTIVCLSVTPPNVKEYGILPMSYVDYTLYVPEESMELYASAEQWSQFAGKIKPLSVYVAVDAPKADVDCVIRNGRVMVSNVSSSDVVEVYSFTGQKLLHVKAVNGRAEFDAPNDHFIVKVGDCALKVQ